MEWWIYLIVILGVIAVYFISALIIRFFMKRAQKKCFAMLDDLLPKERDRFEVILEVKNTMEGDGRFLPKNLVDTTNTNLKAFEQIPADISQLKGTDDFLILYYRKYLKEKKLLNKYKELDEKLAAIQYLDPEDKTSPYYAYNKAALKYNSYLSMGFINPFKGGQVTAPTL